jgi:uncharacterized surface protein with fasciclin (FAS1) repeats
MKHYPLFKVLSNYKFVIIFILFSCLLFTFCTQEPTLWTVKSTEQVASDYIKSKPEYSEFAKLVEMTGMEALLGIRGPYTIMLPNNDAMFAYYKEKGVSGLEGFSEEFRNTLIRNHLITNEISTGDIGLGALRDTNAIGDYLVTEFEGSDIILNKYSKIINRDVRLANGYAHVIDHVLDPITKDIYTSISENPSFKIFTEGLKISGIKDTLQLISFPYGNRVARTRFTLLAVPDSVYQRKGINNIDDLIKYTGANPDSLTFLNNPFYRYMEYHCLNGTHYLSDLNTQLYPILSHDNNVSMTIDTDYKINYIKKTDKYTGFYVPQSNTPSKNGAIHVINNLLPVIEPEPSLFIQETTDYFDIQQGDYIGKYYMKWGGAVGQTQFKYIKWKGDYLLYYYKPNHGRTAIAHNDNLSMLGFWTIEITTEKVMKGHYKIGANIWTGGEDLPIFDVYLDGVRIANNVNARISSTKMEFGEQTWTKTERHTMKLVCTGWGVIFWDTIIFTPVQ